MPFIFLYNFCSKHFFAPINIMSYALDTYKNACGSSCKVSPNQFAFNQTWNELRSFIKTPNIKFKKFVQRFTIVSCVQMGKQADKAILTEGCECT
jgi:hypothetical protein